MLEEPPVRRAGFFRFVERTLNKFSRRLKKPIGKDLYLNTAVGTVRVFAYNLERLRGFPCLSTSVAVASLSKTLRLDNFFMINIANNASVKVMSIDYSLSPEARVISRILGEASSQ
ncbi:MAG TPA: hypothetical protein VK436_11500 [Methanocella sp.]|nr:hypothetical protein [Methanocella sp.]